jgi:predicted AlkP superfamily phosphohydrolase/phosphomutase
LFSVALEAGVGGESPFVDTTTFGCEGFTDGKLDALFPAGCGGVWVTDGIDTFQLFPWHLEVINRKNLMTVRINFTTLDNFVFGHPAGGEFAYVSDRFPAMFMPNAEGFTIVVDELDKSLTKVKEPDKGKVVGTVSFGSIVYTPSEDCPICS